jgi:hypothetical protein
VASGAVRPFWRKENLLSLLGFEPWTLQSIASSLHILRYFGSLATVSEPLIIIMPSLDTGVFFQALLILKRR